MKHPFKHYQTVFISNSDMAETRENDRKAVVVPDNGYKVGGVLILKSESDVQHKNEMLNDSIVTIITAIDRNNKINSGFCCVQYQTLHHVLPRSLYRLLSDLVQDNNELREKLSEAVGMAMRKAIA